MKSRLREVTRGDKTYQVLMFVCPGCIAGGPDGYEGIHELPVNSPNATPSWDWNGSLDRPTLKPSILTHSSETPDQVKIFARCHSYLTEGNFHFLEDSEHSLAGEKFVPMPDLPEWAERL